MAQPNEEKNPESIKAAEKAIEQIEAVKTEMYDVFGSTENDLYKNLDESQIRLQEFITDNPSVVQEDGGKTAYKEGGKTENWWNEKVTLSEFLFGGKTKKYLTGTGDAGDVKKKKTLFAQAAAKQSTAKTTVDKHESIELTENEFPGISEKLKEIQEIRDRIAEDEAKLTMIEGEVKQIGKDKFLDLYEKNGRNPDTFKMRGELGGCIMVIPQDRYIMIDEGRAAGISKDFGPGWVDTKTQYIFDDALLQKYEEVLDELISGSDKIADEDKGNLIRAKVTYSVKKGSIDNLYQRFQGKLKGIFQAIQPVFALKHCK